VNSDGTLKAQGNIQYLQGNPAYPPTPLAGETATPALPDFPACGLDDSTNPNAGNPVAQLSIDSSGKFLFVALPNTAVTYSYTDNTIPGAPVNKSATADLPSQVIVLSIGSDATLTPVNSNFTLDLKLGFQTPNFAALAVSTTVFPSSGVNGAQNGCSLLGNSPPTSEYLYVADSANYVVWEFSVDTTSGALSNPPNTMAVPSFATDAVPAGVAVDPCDRFVYVSGSLHNTISAYTICTTMIANGTCPFGNGALVPVSGSPFSASGSASVLGPLVVDPFGNNVYAVGTASNTVSGFKISSITGSLTALSPATVATGSQPKSIVIRGDDNWMFVSNYLSGTVSQYSITPATGNLSVLPTLQTDNFPFGVAVK
jgi:hypothetical protein